MDETSKAINEKQKIILSFFEDYFGMPRATALFENEDFLDNHPDTPAGYGNGYDEVVVKPEFLKKLKNSGWMFRILTEAILAYDLLSPELLEPDAVALANSIDCTAFLSLYLKDRLFGIEQSYLDALSGEKYESASASFNHLILVPHMSLLCSSRDIVWLQERQRVEFRYENVHALRKLLNMACDKCLVVCKTGSQFQAVGFAPRVYIRHFPAIVFQGHMAWSFCAPDFCDQDFNRNDDFEDWVKEHTQLRFQNERFLFPIPTYREFEEQYWQKRLEDLGSGFSAGSMAKVLTDIMYSLLPRNSSLLLILSDDQTIQEIVNRLCNTGNRGFWLQKPTDPKMTKDYLKQFCKIDGAILMDLSGRIHAYGVILDGLFTVTEEPGGMLDSNTKMMIGDMSRGSRYNSGRLFAASEAKNHPDKPLFSIIVSEDGMSECELTVCKSGKLIRYPEKRDGSP